METIGMTLLGIAIPFAVILLLIAIPIAAYLLYVLWRKLLLDIFKFFM